MPWTSVSKTAFENLKYLANAALFYHPSCEVKTRLVNNTSDTAMSDVLEYLQENEW